MAAPATAVGSCSGPSSAYRAARRANVPPLMAARPAESPSMLSRGLKALVIPTSQRTVTPQFRRGWGRKLMETPPARATRAAAAWARSFPRGESPRVSSQRPVRSSRVAPATRPSSPGAGGGEDAAAPPAAGDRGRPPRGGGGRGLGGGGGGPTHHAGRGGGGPDGGGEAEGREEGRHERAEEGREVRH